MILQGGVDTLLGMTEITNINVTIVSNKKKATQNLDPFLDTCGIQSKTERHILKLIPII